MDEAARKANQKRIYFVWQEAGQPVGRAILHLLQAKAEAELGLNPAVDDKDLATGEREQTAS